MIFKADSLVQLVLVLAIAVAETVAATVALASTCNDLALEKPATIGYRQR